MKVLFAIAAGGALGAIGRYVAISAIGQLFGSGFPYGTIVVNVFGSFALGTLIEGMTLIWSPSIELRSFSFDVVTLMERNDLIQAALYIIISVTLSVAAFFLGIYLFRQLFS